MSALPSWLKRSLIASGRMSESGLTRRARVVRCRKCGVPTMAGYDAAVAALDAWCDLTDLSALGEALALCEGRRTYTLWEMGDRLELDARDRWMITGQPAGTGRTVLTEHRCAAPVPALWAAPQPESAPELPDPDPDTIPF